MCVCYSFLLGSVGQKTTPRPSVPPCKLLFKGVLFQGENLTFSKQKQSFFLASFLEPIHYAKIKMEVEHALQLLVSSVWNKTNESNSLLLLKVPAIKSFDDHCTDKLNENSGYYLTDVVSTDSWKSVCFPSDDNLYSPHTFLPQHLLDTCCPTAVSYLSKSQTWGKNNHINHPSIAEK